MTSPAGSGSAGKGQHRYTQGHEPATLASHGRRTAQSSCAYLLPVLEPGMRVLDVGCGPGTITLDLAEVVAPGEVVGIEPVAGPLAAARDEAARRGDTTTRFEQADVLALPHDDDSFDVVHAHQVLQHVTDPVTALTEMARVCRPGGWVAARDADYAAMAWFPEVPELDEWRSIYRDVARGNGAEPDAGRRLRGWARAAGLADVRLSTSVWTYADDRSCRWWGESQAERYVGRVFAEQAAEHGVDAEQLARIGDGWWRWSTAPDAWFAVVHGELLARLPLG
ncbi:MULTISPECIES: methyltransferase domain-containing protein [unclassified Knoellia]|uniref:methyltransferase domain-containing protein n=1 Tax=Knoellia altitudinis TaxID=3404795 RepID=UPI003607A04A